MAKPLTISFASVSQPKSGVLVVMAGQKGALGAFGKSIDKAADGALHKAMKAASFTGKAGTFVDIWAPAKLGVTRIVIAGSAKGERKGAAEKDADWLGFGGALMGRIANGSEQVALALELDNAEVDISDIAADIAYGMRLRHYSFDKYKTKKGEDAEKSAVSKVVVMTDGHAKAKKLYDRLGKIADGVDLARDLVNEPANELGPLEFAARAGDLAKLGVEIDVLTEKDMRKLKMGALLGVAQGSVRPPRMVVMQWNGAVNKKAKPIAFIGKGVVFDTGGISIKPAGGMEDMKGDMGGAAAVTGLMHALAARKAKVNAVGIIGLVENMPDGNAQRPGDIVRSMSGQTIEVINTDAEGRLVLADALWYANERFKPQFMINLATLTGAVIVALGQHHAGLFSNNDELAQRLTDVGIKSGERVWRLPLGPEYDKMIDSKFADMKNTGGRYGGSITAAQFLQRFVSDVPWAHLDIAGTAMGSPSTDTNQSWGSGFGVRLLDRLVKDHYEA